MKKTILFLFFGVCLFLFSADLHAMECQIVDGEGNVIYSADAGEVVYFKSIYAYSKPKKLAWNLMVTLPSVDLKNYKTSMKHNGYFFHEGSLENKSRLIPIVIPKDNFIEGNATFKYTMTSNGNCYVYLTILQDSEPPSTSTLTATAVSTSRIDLSWTACTDNKGVAGYKIHNSNGTHLRTVNGTSTYFDNLNPSTQYCYTVTAHDGAGNESAHSNQACATTLSEQQDTTAPSIPTLTATAASSSRIDLSWSTSTDNVGVAGYKIYNGSGTYLSSGNGTSTSFTGLNPNTQYCYKITAYDAANNESGYSNTACATTLPSQTTGKTWNLTANYSYGDDVLNISITSNPTDRTFDFSITGVSGDPWPVYVWWTFIQSGNQFGVVPYSNLVDEDTALFTGYGGWNGNQIIYPSVTKSGVISQIPSWFNFNAPFTFVFDSSNSYVLNP